MKNKATARLLWFIGCFGIFGLHHFYLGRPLKAILYIFTGGFFFIGAALDFFSLGAQVDQYNTKYELDHIRTATGALLADRLTANRK